MGAVAPMEAAAAPEAESERADAADADAYMYSDADSDADKAVASGGGDKRSAPTSSPDENDGSEKAQMPVPEAPQPSFSESLTGMVESCGALIAQNKLLRAQLIKERRRYDELLTAF